MGFEPTTDREHIIQLDSKIDKLDIKFDSKFDSLIESMNNMIKAFEKLETTKVNNHEFRLLYLEKKENERGGAYKFFGLIIIILGAVVTVLTIKTFIQ